MVVNAPDSNTTFQISNIFTIFTEKVKYTHHIRKLIKILPPLQKFRACKIFTDVQLYAPVCACGKLTKKIDDVQNLYTYAHINMRKSKRGRAKWSEFNWLQKYFCSKILNIPCLVDWHRMKMFKHRQYANAQAKMRKFKGIFTLQSISNIYWCARVA